MVDTVIYCDMSHSFHKSVHCINMVKKRAAYEKSYEKKCYNIPYNQQWWTRLNQWINSNGK